MSSFGEIIKEIRESKGMSMGEFAEYVNTSKQNISKWEAGRSSPTLTSGIAISKKLGIPLDELSGVKPRQAKVAVPKKVQNDPDAVKLANTFLDLSEEDRKQLLSFAAFLRHK